MPRTQDKAPDDHESASAPGAQLQMGTSVADRKLSLLVQCLAGMMTSVSTLSPYL